MVSHNSLRPSTGGTSPQGCDFWRPVSLHRNAYIESPRLHARRPSSRPILRWCHPFERQGCLRPPEPVLSPRLRECAKPIRDTFHRLNIEPLSRPDGSTLAFTCYRLGEQLRTSSLGPVWNFAGQIRKKTPLPGYPASFASASFPTERDKKDAFESMSATKFTYTSTQPSVRTNSRVRPSEPPVSRLSVVGDLRRPNLAAQTPGGSPFDDEPTNYHDDFVHWDSCIIEFRRSELALPSRNHSCSYFLGSP